jgi:AcrR family transcriptional regulator
VQRALNIQKPLDKRTRRTRKALRLALQHLLLERPFEQITVREIAEEADTAYTTFFRNYADKDSLLSDLADEEISALLDLTLPIFAEESSFASSLALCEAVHRNARLWGALLTGGAAGKIRETFIAQTEMKEDLWAVRSDWLPSSLGAPLLCGIALEILSWWLGKEPYKSAEEVAGIMDRFFRLTRG